jgi:hypothetical protein
MAMDHNASGRRPHYHRGRRGTDRRGNERRTPPQAPDQGARPSGDQTDVEQIMRDIRTRISQRSGIELSNEQIQELAARRLEAILDPRTINPGLLDQLRKDAAAAPDPLPKSAEAERSISDDAIYEGGALLRFFRRLLNPLLKLLFNPAPLVAALQAQARTNRDATARAVELERRQTEWNALHYQILQRLVTEVSRTSIEMQSLSMQVEALSARVDFNDRRVRTLETVPAPTRSPRQQEVVTTAPATSSPMPANENSTLAAPAQTADGNAGVAAGAAGEVRCRARIRAAARRLQPSRRQKTPPTSMTETTRTHWRCRRPRSRCRKTSRQHQHRRRSQQRHRSHHRPNPMRRRPRNP